MIEWKNKRSLAARESSGFIPSLNLYHPSGFNYRLGRRILQFSISCFQVRRLENIIFPYSIAALSIIYMMLRSPLLVQVSQSSDLVALKTDSNMFTSTVKSYAKL